MQLLEIFHNRFRLRILNRVAMLPVFAGAANTAVRINAIAVGYQLLLSCVHGLAGFIVNRLVVFVVMPVLKTLSGCIQPFYPSSAATCDHSHGIRKLVREWSGQAARLQ